MRFVMKLIKFLIVFVFNIVCAADGKFLLISGPSGIGKSTIIKELHKLDNRFQYIKPFTTRPLREGEVDKIHMPLQEMLELQERGRLVALNYLYGNYYATALDPILDALANGAFPIIDWPINRVLHMREALKDQIVSVFLYVDEIEQLSDRLKLDDRDKTGERFISGKSELNAFFRGEFDELIDYKVNNHHGDASTTAKEIYTAYLSELSDSEAVHY